MQGRGSVYNKKKKEDYVLLFYFLYPFKIVSTLSFISFFNSFSLTLIFLFSRIKPPVCGALSCGVGDAKFTCDTLFCAQFSLEAFLFCFNSLSNNGTLPLSPLPASFLHS